MKVSIGAGSEHKECKIRDIRGKHNISSTPVPMSVKRALTETLSMRPWRACVNGRKKSNRLARKCLADMIDQILAYI